MLKLYGKVKALLVTRDRGATAAEYAMIVAAITAAVALVVFAFGETIGGLFTEASASISGEGE